MTTKTYAAFLDEAERQHNGGAAGEKGITFQHFVAAVELLKLSVWNCLKAQINPSLISEAEKSKVDDLHVVWPEGVWSYQIKAVSDLKWGDVREKFVEELRFHKSSKLFLIVHDPVVEDSLVRGRPMELESVIVQSLPLHWKERTHRYLPVRKLLDGLILNERDIHHHFATWVSVCGTWTTFRGGQLNILYRYIRMASKHTLRPPRPLGYEAEEQTDERETSEGGLRLQAVGDTLIVKDDVIFTSAPLPESWGLANDDFWNSIHPDPWELYDKLGGLRERNP